MYRCIHRCLSGSAHPSGLSTSRHTDTHWHTHALAQPQPHHEHIKKNNKKKTDFYFVFVRFFILYFFFGVCVACVSVVAVVALRKHREGRSRHSPPRAHNTEQSRQAGAHAYTHVHTRTSSVCFPLHPSTASEHKQTSGTAAPPRRAYTPTHAHAGERWVSGRDDRGNRRRIARFARRSTLITTLRQRKEGKDERSQTEIIKDASSRSRP